MLGPRNFLAVFPGRLHALRERAAGSLEGRVGADSEEGPILEDQVVSKASMLDCKNVKKSPSIPRV